MRSSLLPLIEAVEEFRKAEPRISGSAMAVFLHVAREVGLPMSEAVTRVGVHASTLSRTIGRLSNRRKSKSGNEGAGLLFAEDDADDARGKTIYLTAQGEQLAAALERLMEGAGETPDHGRKK